MTENDYLKQIDYVIESGPYTDSWQSLCKHKTPEWYKNAKFGIFIHWGIYSVPAFGNEWYSREMYDKSKPAYRHHREKYGNHVTCIFRTWKNGNGTAKTLENIRNLDIRTLYRCSKPKTSIPKSGRSFLKTAAQNT